MSYLIPCCDEIPEKEAAKGGRLYLGSQFKEGTVYHGEGRESIRSVKLLVTSHTGWQQRMLDAGAQLAFSFY